MDSILSRHWTRFHKKTSTLYSGMLQLPCFWLEARTSWYGLSMHSMEKSWRIWLVTKKRYSKHVSLSKIKERILWVFLLTEPLECGRPWTRNVCKRSAHLEEPAESHSTTLKFSASLSIPTCLSFFQETRVVKFMPLSTWLVKLMELLASIKIHASLSQSHRLSQLPALPVLTAR